MISRSEIIEWKKEEEKGPSTMDMLKIWCRHLIEDKEYCSTKEDLECTLSLMHSYCERVMEELALSQLEGEEE